MATCQNRSFCGRACLLVLLIPSLEELQRRLFAVGEVCAVGALLPELIMESRERVVAVEAFHAFILTADVYDHVERVFADEILLVIESFLLLDEHGHVARVSAIGERLAVSLALVAESPRS